MLVQIACLHDMNTAITIPVSLEYLCMNGACPLTSSESSQNRTISKFGIIKMIPHSLV